MDRRRVPLLALLSKSWYERTGASMAETETYTPETLDEVGALLLAADGQPRPLARGTSLIARSQGEPAPIVVALTHVPELNRLDYRARSHPGG